MARSSKCFLHSLNAFYTFLGLGLAAGSLWFYIEVVQFTSLRNSNHYLLDYNVYWPQAIPWMFIIVGLLTIGAASCGFTAAKRESRKLLFIYSVFTGVVILLLIAAAVIALVFADSKATDNFIRDTVWDAYFQAKTEPDTEKSFQVIEKKLHCCGADSPRDYKNWKDEFPQSCCDVYYHGLYDRYPIDCQFTNKLANERYGCSTVAVEYARIAIKALSAVSLFTALIGIISLVVGLYLSRNLKRRTKVLEIKNETESKKGLL